MPTPNPSSPAVLREKAHDRMSDIFNAAAEAEGVSPEAFRQAIMDAIRYSDLSEDGTTPEAFVLSVIAQLF